LRVNTLLRTGEIKGSDKSSYAKEGCGSPSRSDSAPKNKAADATGRHNEGVVSDVSDDGRCVASECGMILTKRHRREAQFTVTLDLREYTSIGVSSVDEADVRRDSDIV